MLSNVRTATDYWTDIDGIGDKFEMLQTDKNKGTARNTLKMPFLMFLDLDFVNNENLYKKFKKENKNGMFKST